MLRITFILSCILILGACSQRPQLDNASELADGDGFLISAGLNGDGQTSLEVTRAEKLAQVTDRRNDFASKLLSSQEYYQSFEGNLVEVMSEFTVRLEDIYRQLDLRRMAPFRKGKKYDIEKSFYALAATLDTPLRNNSRSRQTSFYELIKVALVKEVRGESMSAHEEVLVAGINKEMMLDLLRARVDIVSAIALMMLTDEKEMNFTQKARKTIFKITGGRFGTIKLPETYHQSDETTKLEIERHLLRAITTRDFLAQIGTVKDLDKSLASAFENISLNTKNSAPATDPRTNRVQGLIKKLL
jgi:hypothetical protein